MGAVTKNTFNSIRNLHHVTSFLKRLQVPDKIVKSLIFAYKSKYSIYYTYVTHCSLHSLQLIQL